MKAATHLRPALTLGAISVIWGSTWIANQLFSASGTPLALLALRYLVAALAILLVALLQGRVARFTKLPPEDVSSNQALRTGPLLGVTMFAAPNLLVLWASHHGGSGWAPILYACLPMALLIATGLLRGTAIMAVGAMLMLLNGSFPVGASKLAWSLPIAGAVALQGWTLVHLRQHWRAAVTFSGLFGQFLTAAGLLGLASAATEASPRLVPSWSASTLTALATVALLGTAAAYPLYYRLLAQLEPAQLAVSQWLQTLVAITESAWLLGQRPGWKMSAAAAVLAACAVLMLRDSHQQDDLRLVRIESRSNGRPQ